MHVIKKNNMRMTMMSVLVGVSLLTGCGTSEAQVQEATIINSENISVNYTKDDYYTKVNKGRATKISLGNEIKVSGNGATAEGTTVTITAGGTYIIDGTLEDGQIVIDCVTEETIRLVLNGVNITSSHSAPIYAKNAEKVVISLEEGTENTFTDTANYVLEADSDEPNATIFSKGDLTINGTGTLKVNANYEDAIVSKDKLKVVEGNIIVNSVDDAIRGKDMVAIKDGSFNITSGGDGIKSTNTEEVTKGFVYIEGGNFDITSEGDGIQAETEVEIADGTFNITAGGGSENGRAHSDNMMMGMGQRPGNRPSREGTTALANEGTVAPENEGMIAPANEGMTPPEGMEFPEGMTPPEGMKFPEGMTPPEGMEMPEGMMPPTGQGETATTEEEDTVSTKGIKATSMLIINGGKYNINSADDAIHCNNNVLVNAGTLKIATGDDALHADIELTINGGEIDITESYEGLEGQTITVNNGNIQLVASDDGVNASDGTGTEDGFGDMMNGSGTGELIINGGTLYVNASGDGLDANGNITVNGGTTVVDGPTNGGNGALDYDQSCNVNGGTLVVSGSAQMAQTASTSSTINTINMTFSAPQEEGQIVAILDESGSAVVAFKAGKTAQVISISSPSLETGKTYTLAYGGEVDGILSNGLGENVKYTDGTTVCEFTIEDTVTYFNESGITTGGSGMGMGMGGHGGGMRGQGGNRNQDKQQAKQEVATEEQTTTEE